MAYTKTALISGVPKKVLQESIEKIYDNKKITQDPAWEDIKKGLEDIKYGRVSIWKPRHLK